MGAWAHLLLCNVLNTQRTGDIDFDLTALIDLRDTLLRWFDSWLKDIDTGVMQGPPVTVFTMGDRPRVRYGRYYLHSGGQANSAHGDGTLSTVPPGEEPGGSYTFDPQDPVPTLGGMTSRFRSA